MYKFRQTVHFQFLVSVEEWPIETDLADCERLAKNSTTDGRKGCKQPPPLKIPFQFVVVDTLHMFLRIMGRLFNELLSMWFWDHSQYNYYQHTIQLAYFPFIMFFLCNFSGYWSSCADCWDGYNKGRIQIFRGIQSTVKDLEYEIKWTALDGKQLQIVLEKIDITRIMGAVGNVDAEGVSELWRVSSPYFLYLLPHSV